MYFSYLHNTEAHILLDMYRPLIHVLYGDHRHLSHPKLLFHSWLNFDTISNVWFPGEFCLKWLQVYLGQESVQHFSEVGSRQNNYRLPGEKRQRKRARERDVKRYQGQQKTKAWETVPSIDSTSCSAKMPQPCVLMSFNKYFNWQHRKRGNTYMMILQLSCMYLSLHVIPLRQRLHSPFSYLMQTL